MAQLCLQPAGARRRRDPQSDWAGWVLHRLRQVENKELKQRVTEQAVTHLPQVQPGQQGLLRRRCCRRTREAPGFRGGSATGSARPFRGRQLAAAGDRTAHGGLGLCGTLRPPGFVGIQKLSEAGGSGGRQTLKEISGPMGAAGPRSPARHSSPGPDLLGSGPLLGTLGGGKGWTSLAEGT